MNINSNPIRQIEESIELLRGQSLRSCMEYLLGVCRSFLPCSGLCAT